MTTGYLTYMQMVELKLFIDKANLDSDRIDDLIVKDALSLTKHRMNEGRNYYEGRHDILDHKNYYYVKEIPVEAVAKANNKLPHPFHQILVDQKVSYIAGNPIVLSVQSPELENADAPTPEESAEIVKAEEFQSCLDEVIDENFDDMLNDWIKDSSNEGVGWLHFFISPAEEEGGIGRLDWITIPPMQCLPIFDSKYQRELMYMIRYYKYDLVVDGKTMQRYKVEWWDKEKVTYYAQNEQKKYALDPDAGINPAWNWTTVVTAQGKQVETVNSGWGRVPFIALPNNSEWRTDLMPIKPLIDAYDMVKSGWINDIEDFASLVYVIKNYSGIGVDVKNGMTELATIMRNIMTDKAIRVDTDGGVDTLKAEIPIEARDKVLAIMRKEIFYFGQGIDVDDEKLSASPSGVSLKFKYASLDLKANRIIRKLKKALKDFSWFVTTYINLKNNTDFDPCDITATINKSLIFNELEKMTALNSDTLLSEQTKLENHPLVDDVEEEMRRLEDERAKAAAAAYVNLDTIPDPNADPNAAAPAQGKDPIQTAQDPNAQSPKK
jgi:SPP1 family phage portal protein